MRIFLRWVIIHSGIAQRLWVSDKTESVSVCARFYVRRLEDCVNKFVFTVCCFSVVYKSQDKINKDNKHLMGSLKAKYLDACARGF